jgi:hypothetical protein
MRFKAAPLVIVSVITGCASYSISSFRTESSTAGQYHAVPTYRWSGMGNHDAARVAAISREPLYGPFPANRTEKLIDGTSYFFIPVCDGVIRPDKKKQDVVSRGGATSIEC